MKKYWLAALLDTMVLAAGCKGNSDTEEVTPATSETEASKEDIAAGASTLSEAGKSAYRSVLEDIYYNQQFPNSLELDYDGSDLSRNRFAVLDVDGDGRSELLISYITASTDGQAFLVYDFVEALDAVHEEFMSFPTVTFYDNGVARADWSDHPGTLENSDFQPFTLYLYNKDENVYGLLGTAFQKDDPDVYYQNLVGDEDETEVDETVLKDWLDTTIGDAAVVDVPMMKLTPENIRALK